ncbi:hypothetical protein E1263_03305 [Kribbella antibiotica]|uniref:Uncharacterized protein n=1 Tax=Kribbella antibiotica TaxID=190195 RepID=A0A4R4ZWJ8_9ACTN|nr:hypothetical protein [Kribbella antibiotica]TDD62479.1 hypothetical protein E1263_03305 [Kribbella antibiotica]
MRSKRLTWGLATALVVASTALLSVAPAQAVGGNCSAGKDKNPEYDQYRGKAACKSLQGDSRARPKLIRDGGPDYTGAYFTRLDTLYYTKWYGCYLGCEGAYEIAHV